MIWMNRKRTTREMPNRRPKVKERLLIKEVHLARMIGISRSFQAACSFRGIFRDYVTIFGSFGL